jgi:hypothetical protein
VAITKIGQLKKLIASARDDGDIIVDGGGPDAISIDDAKLDPDGDLRLFFDVDEMIGEEDGEEIEPGDGDEPGEEEEQPV